MKHLTLFAAAVIALAAIPCAAQTVSESKSLDLTLRNTGETTVRDVRTVTLAKGENRLEIDNMPSRLVLWSMIVLPVGPDFGLDFLQWGCYAPPEDTFEGLVGSQVWFDGNRNGILLGELNYDGDNATAPVRLPDGRVAVRANIEAVSRMSERQVTLDPNSRDDFWDRPFSVSLRWLISSPTAKKQDVEVHYVTQGLSWEVNYVALINKNSTSMDLTGWVDVDNSSGVTFSNASIRLRAGNVRRYNALGPEPPGLDELERIRIESDRDGNEYALFQERDPSKHHTYTFDRLITLREYQKKQLSLMNVHGVRVKTRLVYDPRLEWWEMWGRQYGANYQGADASSAYHKVHANLDFVNSKANHLGRPMPWGKVRVLKVDDDGSEQFVGEDELFATAEGKTSSLYIGDAFDVLGDYRRFNAKAIDKHNAEEDVEAVIHNHKDQTVTVDLTDHAWPGWSITANSHKFTKMDESTFVFPIKVPANGTTKVTYTIHTTWKDEDRKNEEY